MKYQTDVVEVLTRDYEAIVSFHKDFIIVTSYDVEYQAKSEQDLLEIKGALELLKSYQY